METRPFILVCDDSRAIAASLVHLLQAAGYRSQAVESALGQGSKFWFTAM